MKSTSTFKFVFATLIAVAIFGNPVHAAPSSTTPVAPVVIDTGTVGDGELDPVTLEYNDTHPMPTRIREISDPAATKSAWMRQITHGIIRISGAITGADGIGTLVYVAGTPQQIVDTMSKHVFNLVFLDPTVPVTVSVELREETDRFTLLQSFASVYPTRTESGDYQIKQELQLTLNHGGYIDIPEGVTEVKYIGIEEGGYVNTFDSYVFENHAYFPFRSYAGNHGRVIMTRNEPVTGGGFRRVVYSYDLETGLPASIFDGQYKTSIGIQNYRELTDEGLPIVWPGGDILAMPVDLTVVQNLTVQDGYVKPQDPMTARVEITVARFVSISTGLFHFDGEAPKDLLERPESFLIFNPATGKEIRAFVDDLGNSTVFLPPGSYDFEIRYRKIEFDPWAPRG